VNALRPPRSLVPLLGAALALLGPGHARGDGAFPDAQNLLTPAAWPNEIILATTFGVVFSQDNAKTWLWTCEQDRNILGLMYQVSPAGRHRVYALANKTVVYSDDMTCSWQISGGAVTGQAISDFWVDRVVADRLFAIGAHAPPDGGTGVVYSVFSSVNGGQTFGPPVYVGAPGDIVTGVETSVSEPRIVYLTVQVAGNRPTLLRSADEGATWEPHDLSAMLGPGALRLVAIDPHDPARVFLMWRDVRSGENLVLTEDGGATATVRFAGTGDGRTLTAFVRSPSGALLLATDTNTRGGLFRSTDRGTTFTEVPDAPQLRAFSVRGDLLYAGTDNFANGYAIATSADDGDTWTAVMHYQQVQAVPACVRSACRTQCEMLTPMLWGPEVCAADAPLPPSDAAVPDDGGMPDAGQLDVSSTGEGGAGGGRDASGPPTKIGKVGGGGGCGCVVARQGGGAPEEPLGLVGGLVAIGFVRRRRRLTQWNGTVGRALIPWEDHHGTQTGIRGGS
jgi:MYXO-CTERM domain-containing protein